MSDVMKEHRAEVRIRYDQFQEQKKVVHLDPSTLWSFRVQYVLRP